MSLDSFVIQKNEVDELKKVHAHVHTKSTFPFIAQINGLRPKCMHLLLAPTHAGKTTFTLSLKRDLFLNNPDQKILCYYSEESKADIRTKFASMFNGDVSADSIDALYELEMKNPEIALFEYLQVMQPNIFIYDNLTTSKIYNQKKPSQQFEFVMKLKDCCQKNNIALVCIAHTGNVTNIKGKLIDENDIKGTKDIVNLAEHLWVLQPIDIGNSRRTFLRVLKHRGYNVDKKFFRIGYNAEKQMLHDMMAVDFDEFKRVFKLRNDLNSKA